mmetsp:Transcript_5087/g.7733  ORF Transcript_5087/g.7733 Transcript_5087/m.7733 type:complete len:82 (+) Transcript_5087:853-1098(+)
MQSSSHYIFTTQASETDKELNECGIAKRHALAVLDTVVLMNGTSVVDRVFLLRDPRGPLQDSRYNQSWSPSDPAWTTDLIS